MSVLVTGGAGYIGSHAVLALMESGEEPIVLDDLSTGSATAVPKGVTLYRGDAGDRGLVERIAEGHSIDAVMHFAGSIVVPDSIADPLAYYENNTARSRSLLRACVNAGIRHFVFSSTAAVYGSPEGWPVKEDAPLRPQSPYGRSKLMTEMMLEDAARAHDLSYAALRYFNVAGADPKGRTGQSSVRSTHLVKVACEASLGLRDGMAVHGTDYSTPDGTCIRDFVHVSDLAHAHVLALGKLRAGSPSFVANLGDGRGYSVLEVIEAVKRVGGRDFAVRTEGRRPGDAAAIVADPSWAERELGWTRQHGNMETIVRTALAWEGRLSVSDGCNSVEEKQKGPHGSRARQEDRK